MLTNPFCIFCRSNEGFTFTWLDDGATNNHCPRCGNFITDSEVRQELYATKHPDHHLLSGAVRELNERGVVPTISKLDDLLAQVRVPKDPIDQMDRVLLSLKRTLKHAGEAVEFTEEDFPIAYAHEHNEFARIIRMMREAGQLHNFGTGGLVAQIEIAGWRRLKELESKNIAYDQAFIAVSFAEELSVVWDDGIKPAAFDAGYRPLRVDKHQHNERIDDLIVAEIKRSGLLIADFTYPSPGVYFEAGFALGLGIPVIWCCRDDEMVRKTLHFDTRQYNHIMWKTPEDLREKLKNRIDATAPSPKKQST